VGGGEGGGWLGGGGGWRCSIKRSIRHRAPSGGDVALARRRMRQRAFARTGSFARLVRKGPPRHPKRGPICFRRTERWDVLKLVGREQQIEGFVLQAGPKSVLAR